jgi:hypothetical protein
MRFTFPKPVSNANSRADGCCKTGLWGSLTALGVCCFTPVLLGVVGLAALRPYVDYYVLLPLMIMFLLLGVYGWIRGGRIIRRN